MITLENLKKTYRHKGREIHALHGVSLHVAPGEIYGVVGQSGAGKSTLIRCVNLLERPDSGRVIVAGQELTALAPAELLKARHKIGMIFQHFNLLASRTVYDNIALPLELVGADKKTIAAKVRPLLALTGLGQKQRVAIARALAAEPQVLLSDEATSALDPKTTEDILNLLKNINEKLGLTILMITHEMEVVKQICHKVALIEDGQLVETADVDTFFTAPQSELGQRFVAQTQRFDLPDSYQQRLTADGKHPVVKIRFLGNKVDEPLLSSIARRFDVNVSIIQAKIEHIGHTTIGLIIAEILGDATRTADAVAWLQTQPVNVEVLGHVA